ncbi:hypothetical protein PRZ48_005369 [Zasmidium cellare]|uniref:Uncharacterized protein n=1 Tax=Zasmidium cellare TaxID=395010 RepID=A0ABR0ETE7_ZASCE|nr:hypothetical protein PRZ48_005369 [Zasmidium cellare]
MSLRLALRIFIKEIVTIFAAVCLAVTLGRLLVMLPDLPWWARALMGIGIGFCGVAVVFAMTSARRKAVVGAAAPRPAPPSAASRPAARLHAPAPAPPPPAPRAPSPQDAANDIELQPLPRVAVPAGRRDVKLTRFIASNSDEDEQHEERE